MAERQTALITGPSSGIGLDLARLFAADGYNLVLVARSEGKLRDLAAELSAKFGINADVIPADLTVPNAAQTIVASLKTNVDVLVNNAGFGQAGQFVEIDLQRQLDMIQVNVVALTQLTHLLLRPMVARNRGRILNVASTAAFQPGPRMAVYYATKAFVLSFSEALSDELRHTAVTVTTLCPGPTTTGFAAAADMTKSRLFKVMRPMSSVEVAKIGYEGMKKGKRLVITGAMNRMLVQSLRISPRRLVTRIAGRLQEED